MNTNDKEIQEGLEEWEEYSWDDSDSYFQICPLCENEWVYSAITMTCDDCGLSFWEWGLDSGYEFDGISMNEKEFDRFKKMRSFL